MLISLVHLYLRLLRLWKIPRRLILVARCWMHAFHILLLPTWWHFFTLCICPDSPVLLIFLVVEESRWASATSTETRLYEILGVVDDISPVQRHGHHKNMLFSYPSYNLGMSSSVSSKLYLLVAECALPSTPLVWLGMPYSKDMWPISFFAY